MSTFFPLPKTMPFRAKAELMVKRGEARDFGHACSLMGQRRKRPPVQQQQPMMKAMRLPYKDE